MPSQKKKFNSLKKKKRSTGLPGVLPGGLKGSETRGRGNQEVIIAIPEHGDEAQAFRLSVSNMHITSSFCSLSIPLISHHLGLRILFVSATFLWLSKQKLFLLCLSLNYHRNVQYRMNLPFHPLPALTHRHRTACIHIYARSSFAPQRKLAASLLR